MPLRELRRYPRILGRILVDRRSLGRILELPACEKANTARPGGFVKLTR
jgi:hypothetical protein